MDHFQLFKTNLLYGNNIKVGSAIVSQRWIGIQDDVVTQRRVGVQDDVVPQCWNRVHEYGVQDDVSLRPSRVNRIPEMFASRTVSSQIPNTGVPLRLLERPMCSARSD